MPIYEYLCNECNQITEIVWPDFDGGPEEIECNHCMEAAELGKEPMAHKVLSIVSHKGKTKGKA